MSTYIDPETLRMLRERDRRGGVVAITTGWLAFAAAIAGGLAIWRALR